MSIEGAVDSEGQIFMELTVIRNRQKPPKLLGETFTQIYYMD